MPVEKFLENDDGGGLVDDRAVAFLLAACGPELAFGLACGAVFVMEMDGKICGENLGQGLGEFPDFGCSGAFGAIFPDRQADDHHLTTRCRCQVGDARQCNGSGLSGNRFNRVRHEAEIITASNADAGFTEIESEGFH